MKIKNGFDTAVANLKSPPADGEIVDDGKDGEDVEEKIGEDGFHMKGGGDSQPYNGHRWGLGCCHYVRQVAEEDTFRWKCS